MRCGWNILGPGMSKVWCWWWLPNAAGWIDWLGPHHSLSFLRWWGGSNASLGRWTFYYQPHTSKSDFIMKSLTQSSWCTTSVCKYFIERHWSCVVSAWVRKTEVWVAVADLPSVLEKRDFRYQVLETLPQVQVAAYQTELRSHMAWELGCHICETCARVNIHMFYSQHVWMCV